MIYTYYKKSYSHEHMLYAKEIATIYGFDTIGCNPAASFVSAYLQEYCRLKKEDALFYPTSKGMARVYPKYIYHEAMISLIKKYGYNKVVRFNIKDKTYNFMIKEVEL